MKKEKIYEYAKDLSTSEINDINDYVINSIIDETTYRYHIKFTN